MNSKTPLTLKVKLFAVAVLVLLFVIGPLVTKKTIKEFNFYAKEGFEITKAVCTKRTMAKRGLKISYKFEFQKEIFGGSEWHLDSREFGHIQEGDSIWIYIAPSNPDYNFFNSYQLKLNNTK